MKRHTILSLLVLTILSAVAASNALAANIQFTNVVDGSSYNYLGTANWFGGAVPTQADGAIFTNSNTYTLTFNGTGNAGSVSFNARNGSVFVDLGAGNLWGVANDFVVGNVNSNSTNWVMISSGVVTSKTLNVGSLNTSVGALVLNGTSMTSTGGTANYLGRQGNGSLVVSNNSTLKLTGLTLGNAAFAGCYGTLTIGANGTVKMLGPASGSAANYALNVGTTTSGANGGYVWLTDSTSKLEHEADISLGSTAANGNGTMIVSNGTVSARNIYILNGSLSLYNGTISNTGTLRAGGTGTGTLTMSGGAVTIGTLVIANGAGMTGTVNVTGGTITTGNTTNGNTAQVGLIQMGNAASAIARLNVSGGSVNALTNNIQVALGSASAGTITLSGTGKLTGGGLQVGFGAGTGAVWVSDSASLVVTNNGANSGAAVLGQAASSAGLMVISNGTVQLTSLDIGPAGQGTLSMYAGRLTADTLTATNGASSVLNFNGGQLTTKNMTSSGGLTVGNGTSAATNTLNGGFTQLGGTLAIANNAMLNGNGTVTANTTIQSGGTLSPGNSLGTLVFSNNLTLAGTMRIELDNAPGANGTGDYVQVLGQLDLSGGTLNFSLLSTLTNSVYVFGQYGTLVGTMAATNGLPSGATLDLNYQGLNQLAVTIPEPSALTLVGTGLLGVAMLARRRRK